MRCTDRLVKMELSILTLYTSRHVTVKSYSSGQQTAIPFASINNVIYFTFLTFCLLCSRKLLNTQTKLRYSYILTRYSYVLTRYSYVLTRYSYAFTRYSYVLTRYSYLFARYSPVYTIFLDNIFPLIRK